MHKVAARLDKVDQGQRPDQEAEKLGEQQEHQVYKVHHERNLDEHRNYHHQAER